MSGHHLLQPGETAGTGRTVLGQRGDGRARRGDRHQPGQRGRDLDPREAGASGRAENDDQVQAAVGHMGKPPPSVNSLGCQDREDLVFEDPRQGLLRCRLQVPVEHDIHAVPGKGWQQILADQIGVSIQELLKQAPDRGKLGGRRTSVWPGITDARDEFSLQAREANHQPTVQVVGEDRGELDPLQKRRRLFRRLLQDTAVELQPTQLTIDVEVWVERRSHQRLDVRSGVSRGEGVINERGGRGCPAATIRSYRVKRGAVSLAISLRLLLSLMTSVGLAFLGGCHRGLRPSTRASADLLVGYRRLDRSPPGTRFCRSSVSRIRRIARTGKNVFTLIDSDHNSATAWLAHRSRTALSASSNARRASASTRCVIAERLLKDSR